MLKIYLRLFNQLKRTISQPKRFYINKILKENGPFSLKSRQPIILFGAAELGKAYARLFKKNGFRTIVFCDNDKLKRGRMLDGVKIIHTDDLLKFPRNIPIIITVHHDYSVKKQLRGLGFKNICSCAYLATLFPGKFKSHYYQNSISSIIRSKDKIFVLFDLLKDQESRQTLSELISYRLSLNFDHFKKIGLSPKQQYFDKSIIKLTENEVFIDGGAYNGDTILSFLKATKNHFKAIYAFEPDHANFKKISLAVGKLKNKRRIHIFKLALGKKAGKLKFVNTGTAGSRVGKDSNQLVKAVSLDQFLRQTPPTFIKLDIEGAEREALWGMKKILLFHKPKLAICAYHKTSDLWEIPLHIKKINPNYQLYLRHYSQALPDTICYGI